MYTTCSQVNYLLVPTFPSERGFHIFLTKKYTNIVPNIVDTPKDTIIKIQSPSTSGKNGIP